MNDREEIINNHYNNYDEDSRLVKNNSHNLEYITTTTFIEKYLTPNCKILEIGAGTGRYSLEYAEKGYEVCSIEYVEHNLNILKSKITPYMNIKAEQGDAIDLSRYEDDTFDITLVLGPLYHLYNKIDIDKAIKEAIRVTKKGGKILFAYLLSDGIFMEWAVDGHLISGYLNDFDENFKMSCTPKDLFASFYIDEFMSIMKNYNIKFLHNISTDGIANLMEDKINNLSKEEFDIFVKYHLSVCERIDLQGFSCHMLYIGEKI